MINSSQPDVVIFMTDEERAIPPYETPEILEWRENTLTGRNWFKENGVSFSRHYTGSLACVPSRPTLFTGQFPDVHGVTQTNGLGKDEHDSRMRWLIPREVPTIGHWFRAAGYDTHYDGKWHMSHADLVDENTGNPLATNTTDGTVVQGAVDRYLAENPLNEFGFSGWVGPEPHGAPLANSGFVRDPLIAERTVKWLEDRYMKRSLGDKDAQKPFFLVVSFVNPHDIVLLPMFMRRPEFNPITPSELDPPDIPTPPTRYEDLSTKPAAQIAYKNSYYSGYGPQRAVRAAYENNEQEYRNLYYRLHAEVDGPLDRVRRALTIDTSREKVIFRTSDHGDLLGAHGGLHQKWFNLYDEATRVPFEIVKYGNGSAPKGTVDSIPTSHVDLIPTALALAGLDQYELGQRLAPLFSEFHPLPGKDLSPLLLDPENEEFNNRAIYFMTRDNMLEGDTLASAMARGLGRANNPPGPLKIQILPHVSTNFEGIVVKVTDNEVAGVNDSFWKITRAYDDPETWTIPNRANLSSSGPMGETYRIDKIPDQYELYDLTNDPTESINLWKDPKISEVFDYMKRRLSSERLQSIPKRNTPRPYTKRKPPEAQLAGQVPPALARGLRALLRKAGMHPEDTEEFGKDVTGKRALIVCTNTDQMSNGKSTGVFASEMTVPYYIWSDAGMEVEIASPLGGVVPIDPQSYLPVIRTRYDDRALKDGYLQKNLSESLAMEDIDIDNYDVIYFAGGWGAAFDLGFSETVGEKVTEANQKGKVLGGVCHGPLGFLKARGLDGEPLVKGRRVTGVTDKQVRDLRITDTPHHPETELRRLGADYRCTHRFRDPFANCWEVDGNIVTGQNQNAAPMVAREIMELIS
jgi:arylsulfatase A-like enzyme/putative intracellular protease/amidase